MPDYYTWSNRKARLPHRCSVCLRVIAPKERYDRCVGFTDGNVTMWLECSHCSSLINTYDLEDTEGMRPQYDTIVGDWEPEDLESLRLLVYFKKGWTRKDGTLYPIP